jgi:hypothetical protein
MLPDASVHPRSTRGYRLLGMLALSVSTSFPWTKE